MLFFFNVSYVAVPHIMFTSMCFMTLPSSEREMLFDKRLGHKCLIAGNTTDLWPKNVSGSKPGKDIKDYIMYGMYT